MKRKRREDSRCVQGGRHGLRFVRIAILVALFFLSEPISGDPGVPSSDAVQPKPGAQFRTTESVCDAFCVRDYGAVADGTTDDTAAIQSAVDAARANAGGVILFPPGTYVVTSVDISDGLTLSGYGAIIRKKTHQGKWSRTFTTQKHKYDGDQDSHPLIIKGFVFDGNRRNQGEYDRYQLEQQHMIFLVADVAKPGRLVTLIEDCAFRDGVADAISVYTNVSAKISNCAATDVFRGGVVVTGGHTDVQITNFSAAGTVHPTGIDVEVDGAGYGKSYRVGITVNGMILDGDFDVGVRDGSTFLGTNILCHDGPFYLSAPNSTVRISNSVFGVGVFGAFGNRITFPGDVTFSNCTFRVVEPGPTEEDRTFAALHMYWNISGTNYRDQSLRLLDCDFKVDPSVEPEDETYAVYTEADKRTLNNRLEVRGGHVAAGYDTGVFLKQGGAISMSGTNLDASTALRLGSAKNYWLNASLDSVSFGNHVRIGEFIVNQNVNNVIAHRNMMLDDTQNTLGTTRGIAANTYRGGRTILGNSPPSRTPGFIGDLYRLKTPAAGASYEWICTRSDPTAAMWAVRTKIGD